jgi:hypothetical protein
MGKPEVVRRMKILQQLILTFVALLASVTTHYGQFNTRLISQKTLGAETADLWVQGNYAYVAGGAAGLTILDVSNPAAPQVRGTFAPLGCHIHDVEVVGNLAYCANYVPNNSGTPIVGLYIADVSDPNNPVEAGRVEWGQGAWYHNAGSSHSIHIESRGAQRIAYVCSLITTQLEVFDVTTPNAAVFLATINNPLQYTFYSQPHEAKVFGNYLVTTWMAGGFTIDDVSNPSAPVRLVHQYTAGDWIYDCAMNAAGTHLLVSHAPTGTSTIRIYNLAGLTNPVPSIALAGTFVSPSTALLHNIAVGGKYAYVSAFTDGLRVLDIGNPAAPVQVGWHDTNPTTAAKSTTGGYGVAVQGNNVFLSHSTGGMYTIDFVDTVAITKAEWRNGTKTLTVEATSSGAPSTTLNVAGFGTMTYNVSLGKYTLVRNAVLTNPGTVNVTSNIGGTATGTVRRR